MVKKEVVWEAGQGVILEAVLKALVLFDWDSGGVLAVAEIGVGSMVVVSEYVVDSEDTMTVSKKL